MPVTANEQDSLQQALLERWQSVGDRHALEQLIPLALPRVYRLADRLLGHAQDAEDVAQQVCEKLIRTRKGARIRLFQHWLSAVTVATARDFQRRQTSQRNRVHSSAELRSGYTPNTAAPDYVVEEREEHALLRAALLNLPDTLREPVVLHYLEGLSREEICEALDLPLSTLRFRLTRGIETLNDVLLKRGVAVSSAIVLLQAWPAPAVPAGLAAKATKSAFAVLATTHAGVMAGMGLVAGTVLVLATMAAAPALQRSPVGSNGPKGDGQPPSPAATTAAPDETMTPELERILNTKVDIAFEGNGFGDVLRTLENRVGLKCEGHWDTGQIELAFDYAGHQVTVREVVANLAAQAELKWSPQGSHVRFWRKVEDAPFQQLAQKCKATDPLARCQAIFELGKMTDPRAVPFLQDALLDPDPLCTYWTLQAISCSEPMFYAENCQRTVDRLLPLLERGRGTPLQIHVATLLCRCPDERAVKAVRALPNSTGYSFASQPLPPAPESVAFAVQALQKANDDGPALKFAQDANADKRRDLASRLDASTGAKGRALLEHLAQDPADPVRLMAQGALCNFGDFRPLSQRLAAAVTLREFHGLLRFLLAPHDPAAVDILKKYLADPRPEFRDAAVQEAIRAQTGCTYSMLQPYLDPAGLERAEAELNNSSNFASTEFTIIKVETHQRALKILPNLRAPEAIDATQVRIKNIAHKQHFAMVAALRSHVPQELIGTLLSEMESPDPRQRASVAGILLRTPGQHERALRQLVLWTRDSSPSLALEAGWQLLRHAQSEPLARIACFGVLSAFKDVPGSGDFNINSYAVEAQKLFGPEVAPILIDKAQSPVAIIRKNAVWLCALLSDEPRVAAIIPIFANDPADDVRGMYVECLQLLGRIEELIPYLDDHSEEIRNRALNALQQRRKLIPAADAALKAYEARKK